MVDSDDEGVTVPIRCDACGTDSTVPLEDVADRIEGHNERLHDGNECAEVDPAVAERFADLVAEDLGLLDGDS
jgi:hypothetical protein